MAVVKGTYWNTILPAPRGLPATFIPIFSETFAPGALNDTRKLLQIPRGLTIGANSWMQVGDMDTSTGLVLTLRLNDGTTQKVLISASTVGQAGGIARPTLIGTTETAVGFTTNSHLWWLELLIATAATGTATSAVFTYGIELSGFYNGGALTE